MKKRILASVLAVMAACAAQASLDYNNTWYRVADGFDNSGYVPDGSPTGWSDTRTVSTYAGTLIGDVNVRLNISGGYNGDLYGYLVHSSGFTVLLNRIGATAGDAFGNTGAGMNVTLDDANATDIHLAAYGYLSGTTVYSPDGRNIDPASSGAAFDAASQTAMLDSFNGLDANGTWTLYFSDMAGGDTSRVESWGLDIQLVPEPITWALLLFGSVLGTAKLTNYWRRRKVA